MSETKTYIIGNTIKTSIVWVAGCSVIKYAISKTGSLAPLLGLLVLPKYQVNFKINNTNEKDPDEEVYENTNKEERKDGRDYSEREAECPETADGEAQE